jgi:hypothetical protein
VLWVVVEEVKVPDPVRVEKTSLPFAATRVSVPA